jgi:MFS family permease
MSLGRDYFEKLKLFAPNARLFLASNIFIAFFYTIFYLFFNLYLRALGFEMDYVGLLNALSAASGGILGIPIGIASDRFGRKRMLVISSLILFLSLLGFSLFVDRILFLIVTIFLGASSAGIGVISNPFMSENSTERERVHLFSVSSALFMIVSTFGNILAGYAFEFLAIYLSDIDAYRTFFLFSALLVFLSIPPLLFIKEKSVRIAMRMRIKNIGLILKFTLLSGIVGLGAGFTIPYFNVFFKEILGVHENFIGLLFGVGSIFVAISTLFSPLISERIGKVKTVFLGGLSSIPFLILIAFSGNLWVASLGYVIRGGLMNMANPVLNAFTMEMVEKEERATASAMTVVAWQVGWAITSKISGDIMRGGDYLTPYVGTIILYLMSSAVLWIFFSKKERR